MNAPARGPSGPASLLAHPTFGRVSLGLAVAQAITDGVQRAKSTWRDHLAYSITITERDPLYADVHTWLTTLFPDDRQRSLLVTTRKAIRSDEPTSDHDSRERARDPLRLMYNEARTRRVTIGGHRVAVEMRRPAADTTTDLRRESEPDRIVFTCATVAAQNAVVSHLRSLHDGRSADRQPVLRMITDWGSWRTRNDLPPRSLDSVVLPPDQLDRVLSDVRGFLAAEDRYNQLGIPWHRGYLFHGPPGTGKTSLVKALATHFGMDLWYVSLSDLKTENSLMNLLSEVAPRSMLLLEDIDTIRISRDRDTEQGSISMSSLLNALDGVATPHGLITVMTTNHMDALDPALTRAGRMDLIEEIAAPTLREVDQLAAHFYGADWSPTTVRRPATPVSMAAVSEVFKRHLNDPRGARRAIDELMTQGVLTR